VIYRFELPVGPNVFLLTFKLAFFDYPHAYTFIISIPDAANLIYFLKSTVIKVIAIDPFVL